MHSVASEEYASRRMVRQKKSDIKTVACMVRISGKNVSTFRTGIVGYEGENKKPAAMCGPDSLADYQYRTLRMTYHGCGVRPQQVGGDVRAM